MFSPTPILLGKYKHENVVLARNLYLTKLKYNPTKYYQTLSGKVLWLSIMVRMLSISTENFKPLENSTSSPFMLALTLYLLYSSMLFYAQHKDVKAHIIDIVSVYYWIYNLYTLFMSSPCIAQSICTEETKILLRCVDI